jgi:tetratricopeptide (TPR) repeat protein
MQPMRYALVGGILIAALVASGPAVFAHDSGMGGVGGGGGGGSNVGGTPTPATAARTYFTQGEDYSKKGDWNLAIQAYLQAVRLDPKLVEAWNNLGFCYRKVQQYDKAFGAYKQALDLRPDYPNAHEYMGRTYIAMGDKDGAMREYEILKRLDGKMAAELLQAIQANNPDLGDGL